MPKITQEDINKTYKELKESCGGLLEDYFALIYLSNEFRISQEEAIPFTGFGNNDYGIDAFYLDRESTNLYLYQFKWSENHHLFEESLKRLRDNGIEMIFGNPSVDKNLNPLIVNLRSILKENRYLINQIVIKFVFNGDEKNAENSLTISNLQEDLENKRHHIDTFFEKEDFPFCISFLSNKTARRVQRWPSKTHSFCIKVRGRIESSMPSGEKLRLFIIKLNDIHKMYKQMKDRLLDRNIRFGLDKNKPVNKKIRNAFKSIVINQKQPPEIFVFNHNGVTLSAQKINFKDDDTVEIIEPRILNGAQTITCLECFIEENKDNPLFKKNYHLLDSLEITAKIISDTNDDNFITSVTICNNQQNAVEPWHLRANDEIQTKIHDYFKEGITGLFYERQEKAFESHNYDELEDLGYNSEHSKCIEIKNLAKTFLALQGEVDKVSRLRDVFENDKDYLRTFKESYLDADVRKIILAYKTQMVLNRVIRYITEKFNKYWYIRNTRNTLYSLLIQGILNDDDIEQISEDYGKDLIIQSNFVSYLKDMVSRKIRLIIAKAIEKNKDYSTYLDEDKYAFFRTKEFFKSCMEIAYRKYKWKQLSL